MEPIKDVTEPVGGSAKFHFRVPHEGAPIEWMHNGKRLYPERDPQKYQIISDGLNKTLVIKDLKEEEQGTMAVKIGNHQSTAKLHIQGLYMII